MSIWPSAEASRVMAALRRIGWDIKRQSGSHKTLAKPGSPDVVFAFHEGEEARPRPPEARYHVHAHVADGPS
jgi:predicted RNA binding protein YcfA (HicA-like mRNA interferase family)